MYTEEYQQLIGVFSPKLTRKIKLEEIQSFARAIGCSDRRYYDEDYASRSAYGRVIAPPTFCFILKYPDIPGVWFPAAGRIHTKQEFSYARPIFAGETISCAQRISNAYEKEGRHGLMVFVEQERLVYDSNENIICSSKMTTLIREELFMLRSADSGASNSAQPDDTRHSPEPLTAGQTLETVTLQPLTRMDIVKYACASGDFNAIHLDDQAAQSVGFPGVIAHGMLSAALQSRVAERWFGEEYAWKSFSFSLKNPVLLGDALSFSGQVISAESGIADIAFTITNQNSAVVISGSIRVEKL